MWHPVHAVSHHLPRIVLSGYVSDRLGDPTPRMSGRLTLNPFKRLDPLGTLCLADLPYGMGQCGCLSIPTIIKTGKKASFLVSWLVPLSMLLLAFVSLLIEGLLMLYGSSSSSIVQTAMSLAYYSAVLNIGLGTFITELPGPAPGRVPTCWESSLQRLGDTLRTLCPFLGTRSEFILLWHPVP